MEIDGWIDKAAGCPTCAVLAVVVAAALRHDAHAVGRGLAHLRSQVAQRLQHLAQEVAGVLEGRGAAVLHHVVEDAQAPLPVGPGPVGTLNATSSSVSVGMGSF